MEFLRRGARAVGAAVGRAVQNSEIDDYNRRVENGLSPWLDEGSFPELARTEVGRDVLRIGRALADQTRNQANAQAFPPAQTEEEVLATQLEGKIRDMRRWAELERGGQEAVDIEESLRSVGFKKPGKADSQELSVTQEFLHQAATEVAAISMRLKQR